MALKDGSKAFLPVHCLWKWAWPPSCLLGGVLFTTPGSYYNSSSFIFFSNSIVPALAPGLKTNWPLRKLQIAVICSLWSHWIHRPSWRHGSSQALHTRMGCSGLALVSLPHSTTWLTPSKPFLRRELWCYRKPHDYLVLEAPKALGRGCATFSGRSKSTSGLSSSPTIVAKHPPMLRWAVEWRKGVGFWPLSQFFRFKYSLSHFL